MDNSSKSPFLPIGIGIVIGAIAVLILAGFGARLVGVDIGPLKFGLSSDTPTPQFQKTEAPLGEPRPSASPTATPNIQPTNTPMISIPRSHWPTSPQEAANFFAKGEGQWEINQYGGWHLIPQWPPIEVTVPLGVTMEGYNDGPSPPQTRRCMTVLGPAQVVIQGGTFWFPDNPTNPIATARKIYSEQRAWTIEQGGPTKCEAFGFQP